MTTPYTDEVNALCVKLVELVDKVSKETWGQLPERVTIYPRDPHAEMSRGTHYAVVEVVIQRSVVVRAEVPR